MKIKNPILPGFNPDPSICRVGQDYYIATSTFEWYPGVQIYHSRDLSNWTLAATPLNRPDLLDMRGVPDSCGIWAPCLTWADGRFWLVYTVTRRFDGNFKDTPNYLTTCETIDGDWSERVYLNSSGFDPSLFHGDDGRKWLLNMVWDHRPDRTFFRGIVLQEYSFDSQALTGPSRIIFEGTELDCTEGPHLYRRAGWYHLMTAEGGTGYGHAVTTARSKDIWGPYEADPTGPCLTARDRPDAPLQRCGHGSLVETPDGDLYLAHLCSRPLPGTRRSPLGRESALQKAVFTEDGWFRLASGTSAPELEVDGPARDASEPSTSPTRDDFDVPTLDPDYQWLRTPSPEDFYSLTERPGFLRLKGRESLGSLFEQALIARRQTDFDYRATTSVDFVPESFQQSAGLVCYYNGHKFHYLYVSTDSAMGRHIGIMSATGAVSLDVVFPIESERIALPERAPVHLRADVRGASLRFSWSLDGTAWNDIPAELDASLLSDEAGKGEGANFTGAFVGLCCQDLTGRGLVADFDYFHYRPGR